MSGFQEELINNVIPFVESSYRVLTDAKNRALAGLSMGGGQAFYVGLPNAEKFASIGVFSSGLFGGIGRGLRPLYCRRHYPRIRARSQNTRLLSGSLPLISFNA